MTKNLIILTLLCGLALMLVPSVAFAAQYGCYCKGDTRNLNLLMETFNNSNECSLQCMTSTDKLCEGYISGSCSKMPDTSPAPSSGEKLTNPLGEGTTLQLLIGRVISAVLGVVGSIALLMFIYGGFLWLTSAGAEQKITQGKQIITWATIGLAVIFLSYTLVNFVISGLGATGGTSSGGGGSNCQTLKDTCLKDAQSTACDEYPKQCQGI